jgi:hypothetical protein
MVELRCNNCIHMKENYCDKLDEVLPNGLAKLFYGGAEGIYAGTVTYPSKCGIEKQHREPQLQIIIPESLCEDEQMLQDPNFAVDNSDW